MDLRTFDRLVAEASRKPSRRGALRLLAGAFLGGFAAAGAPRLARAQDDTDGDGLFDGDELFALGTDPNNYDTDFDTIGDGAEVFSGSDPLTPADDYGLVIQTARCNGRFSQCNNSFAGPYCVEPLTDQFNCGGCRVRCASGSSCADGVCVTSLVDPDQ